MIDLRLVVTNDLIAELQRRVLRAPAYLPGQIASDRVEPANRNPGEPADNTIAAVTAAGRTLGRLGYTWEGGEEWKPPIGKAPDFDLLDAAQRRVNDLEVINDSRARLAQELRNDLEAAQKELEPLHQTNGYLSQKIGDLETQCAGQSETINRLVRKYL